MKRFHFTLRALLVVRERQERLALECYAAALALRHNAAMTVEGVDAELARAAVALRTQLSGGSLAADLVRRQDHYQFLQSRRTQAAAALKAADLGVATALEELLEARRHRKVVDDCQEKQLQRHQREMARQETKAQDELGIRRFAPALVWHGND